MKHIIEQIRRGFLKRLQKKTNWGRNQLIREFERSIYEAVIDNLGKQNSVFVCFNMAGKAISVCETKQEAIRLITEIFGDDVEFNDLIAEWNFGRIY